MAQGQTRGGGVAVSNPEAGPASAGLDPVLSARAPEQTVYLY